MFFDKIRPKTILRRISSAGRLPNFEAIIAALRAVCSDPSPENLELASHIVSRAELKLNYESCVFIDPIKEESRIVVDYIDFEKERERVQICFQEFSNKIMDQLLSSLEFNQAWNKWEIEKIGRGRIF